MLRLLTIRTGAIAFCMLMLSYGVRGLADHQHLHTPYVVYSIVGILLGTAVTPSLSRKT
jgi:hypothetical protein